MALADAVLGEHDGHLVATGVVLKQLLHLLQRFGRRFAVEQVVAMLFHIVAAKQFDGDWFALRAILLVVAVFLRGSTVAIALAFALANAVARAAALAQSAAAWAA